MHRYLARPGILLAIAFFVTGCASLQPEIREPTYRIEGVELLQLGLTEQRFRLTLLVNNPNDRALPVRALRYSVDLEEIPLAEGESEERFTLPANSEHPVRLDVRTRLLQDLPALMRKLEMNQQRFAYQLRGEVDYGNWIRGTRSFERDGHLRLTF